MNNIIFFFYNKLYSIKLIESIINYNFIEEGYIKIESFNVNTNELIFGDNNKILKGFIVFISSHNFENILLTLNNIDDIKYNKLKYKINIVDAYSFNNIVYKAYIIY
jgi:hypothetical protein